MNLDFHFHDYKYFGYEEDLAARELSALWGRTPERTPNGFRLESPRDWQSRALRTTYFRLARSGDGEEVVPLQALLEGTVNGKSGGAEAGPNLSRQSTRYSAHGLHEYRGKFNPQIVRVVGNIIGLTPGDWLFDPFCGSGTTLLEAAHAGWNCLGLDPNPLAVVTANAKLAAFCAPPESLEENTALLLARLDSQAAAGISDIWRSLLPNQDYLLSWFEEPVLDEAATILNAIQSLPEARLHDVFIVILSDALRDFSKQEPADLRIRRRKGAAPTAGLIPRFVDDLVGKTNTVQKARGVTGPVGTMQKAVLGDARGAPNYLRDDLARGHRQKFDAAITSPPYATALPYIDTQRLSLSMLGLTGSDDLGRLQQELIGTREITKGERERLEAEIEAGAGSLPRTVADFCQHLLVLADHPDHGFRRRNVPALIYKYLSEMSQTFAALNGLVCKGGKYALVVGRNTTSLRGETVAIDTPQLLCEIAIDRGWALDGMVELDTYQRYDIHQNNSIRNEILVVLTS